ncbi:MAG: hypothetical protein ABIC40_09090, partial [bacterium]
MKNHTYRIITALLICLLMGTIGSSSAQGQDRTVEEIYYKRTTQIEKVHGGEIDWGNEMIAAWGEGVMPTPSEEPNRAKAYLKAKGYARMQAIANLLMVLEGTAISWEGYGSDYMARDEILRQTVEGYVRGVEVLEMETIPFDGNSIVRVKVGTRMYGNSKPGTAFQEQVAADESEPLIERKSIPELKVELPKPLEIIQEPEPSTPNMQQGPFTSVVIDARGFDVIRAISPKIRKTDGSEVWGTINVTPEFANETGIVSYATDIE